ncbi:MAG: molybdate ABC transporter substrate-binding protein [Carbonactinosporaceae bacterium]
MTRRVPRGRRHVVRALVGVLLLAGVGACGPGGAGDAGGPAGQGESTQVRVAAASSLKFAMDALVSTFERRHGDVEVEVSYGSSGAFFAQLRNHAPYDMFFSADTTYPRRLADEGLTRGGAFGYATGRLVLWAPKSAGLDVAGRGADVLTERAVRRVAVANPRLAPYGSAAIAALKHFGAYAAVRPHLVYGEDVAQTAEFARTGAADVGLLARSITDAPTLRADGDGWLVPRQAHPPIRHAAVTTKWSRAPGAAQRFRAFVLGEQGQAVLARNGFDRPAG